MTRTRRKSKRVCGHCMTRAAVEAGTRYGKYRPTQGGEVEWFSQEDAVRHLRSLCRCPDSEAVAAQSTEGPEIRRPGQRILRPGTPVFVQLKRRPGTRRDKGVVTTCYADNTISVAVGAAEVRVPADEYVKARNR